MAEGFAKTLGKNKVEAFSAGSKPSGAVNPSAIQVMKEIGINITGQKSKGFADLPHREFDYVVSMGCQDVCPFYPSKMKLDWEIEDPKGKEVVFFRKTRDQIKKEVASLIENI